MATTWNVTRNEKILLVLNLLLNVFYKHHSGVQSFFQHKTEHISLRIGPLLGKIFSYFE